MSQISSLKICHRSQTSQLWLCGWISAPSSRWAVWLIDSFLPRLPLNTLSESPSCSRGINVWTWVKSFLFEKTTVWLEADRPRGKGKSLGNPGLMQQGAQRSTVGSGWGWRWWTSVVLSFCSFFLFFFFTLQGHNIFVQFYFLSVATVFWYQCVLM